MGSGINWDEVPPIQSGVDWSKVPAALDVVNPPMNPAKAKSDLLDRQLKQEGGADEPGITGLVHNAAAGIGKFGTDQYLGVKQALTSLFGGDPTALNTEAAEKKKLDAPLDRSMGGTIGQIGAGTLEAAGPFGAAARVAKMLPAVPGMGIVRGMLPAATVGAGQEVLSPDPNYNLTNQAEKGAAAGVAGDVLGRVAGRALSPMQSSVPDTVAQYIDTLRKNFPDSKLLAESLTNNSAVKALTNALAQIPGFGSSIKAARIGNLGDVTEAATAKAGFPTRELSEDASKALHGQLDDTYDYFRRAPPMEAPGMPAALAQARNDTDLESRLFGTNKPATQLRSAENAMTPPPSTIAMPPGVPPPPRPPVKIPIDTALNVRSDLGDQVFRNEAGISTRGAEAVRDELDNALTKRFGSIYPETQGQYGASKDIRAVQNTPTGITPEGHVRPETLLKQFSDREVANPSTPFTQSIKAAADRWASPALSENRSLMVRLLTGSALVGAGGVGGVAGAGAGLGTLALARALLGTEGGGRYLTGQNTSELGKQLQSPKMREFLRLLGTSATNEATP